MKRIIAIISAAILCLSTFSANAATFKSIKKNPDFYYGVDVSVWNDELNWNTLRNVGVEFAYIRVGYYDSKGGHLDHRFKENVKKCVESGIEFGIYVYSYVYKYSDNIKLAKWVNKQIESLGNYTRDKGTIQVAYDIEDQVQHRYLRIGSAARKYVQKSVVKFCNKIKSYGYVPVVYSSESWFYDYLSIDNFRENGIRIWYAQWPYYPDTSKKKIMINKTVADVWQFSSSYTINGTCFDSNVTYDDFYNYDNETSTLTVEGLDDTYVLTKSSIVPQFSVYDGDTLLKEGEDYKLVYFRNERLGRAKIKIIRYKNSQYYERKTVFFIITPNDLKSVKASKVGYDEIKLSWNAVKGAPSYEIYEYDNTDGSYELIDTVDTNSYTDYFLDEGTEYKLKVRPVHEAQGKNYYGKFKKVTATTKYKKIKLLSATAEDNLAEVKWKERSDNCIGYQLQYSVHSDFREYEKLTINDPAINSAQLDIEPGETYYTRIRSFNKPEEKKIYSLYSKVLTIEN